MEIYFKRLLVGLNEGINIIKTADKIVILLKM